MQKDLIILTSNYPFRKAGAIYEEREVLFLSPHFNKIVVICDEEQTEIAQQFDPPSNISFLKIHPKRGLFTKIKAVFFIFHPIVIAEIQIILTKYKKSISPKILAILLVEFFLGWQLSRKLRSCIKKEKLKYSNLIVYSFWNDYRAIAVSLLKIKQSEITGISRAHRGDVYFEENHYDYLPLKNLIIETLDGTFAISRDIKKHLEEKLKKDLPKIIFSPLGSFGNSNFDPENYNPQTGNLTIFSCSNIIPRKRIDLIAKSISLVTEFKISWCHLGGGSSNKSIENDSIEILKLTGHRMHFFGQINNQDLLEFYANNPSDLFINLSESEGVPVSIMEAMSFGMPVLATNVGGTSEIVNDGRNGFLLDRKPKPEEVAEKISEFYHLPIKEKKLFRKNAFTTWKDEYNADENYKKFAEHILAL